MRIFVTGATGVVGRALVPRLVAAGHQVTGMTRDAGKAARLRTMGAEPVVVNAFDRAGLKAAVVSARPDAIIDQLTDLSSWDYAANTRLRIAGSRNLVDAALAAGVRLMVAQSFCLYVPGNAPAGEESAYDFISPRTRVTAPGIQALEKAVAEVPRGVILRYALLYGPGTRFSATSEFAGQVRRGAVPATGGVTSFLHVEDAARAALLALDWPARPVNIADDEPAAGTEWLPAYAAAIGAPPPPVDRSKPAENRGVSNAKARREYGWEPLYPSWRTGFRAGMG